MSKYVIIIRNPQNGLVTALQDEHDNLATWETEAEAEELAANHMLCRAWPYSIVEAP
jgi:hypothetical protein